MRIVFSQRRERERESKERERERERDAVDGAALLSQ